MTERPPGAPDSEASPHIGDVIRRLRTIEASAPRSEGVVCFARLYREVTEGVGAELTRQGFDDSRFLETLDVHFGHRPVRQKATEVKPLRLAGRSADWAVPYYEAGSPKSRERTVLATTP